MSRINFVYPCRTNAAQQDNNFKIKLFTYTPYQLWGHICIYKCNFLICLEQRQKKAKVNSKCRLSIEKRNYDIIKTFYGNFILFQMKKEP